MDEFGRPTDLKPIERGDTFLTFTGRTTTPYPASKKRLASDEWLIANAVEEARSRGDEFNVTVFGGERAKAKQPLPPASIDAMLLYLFVWQPKVVPTLVTPVRGEQDVQRG